MGYKLFQIFVDSPDGSYEAGSNVTGNVVLILNNPKRVKGLFIKFDGFAEVSWTQYDHRSYADEEYFTHKFYLFGSENGDKEIPVGKTVYPFSWTLPSDLPASFEGGHGHVRYTIRAVLDRPWKKDEETKVNITVVAPIDLNTLPHVKDPVMKEASISFCCLCCRSGPLTVACFIPRSGYVPGQSFTATVDVDNASNILISSIKCKLMKEIKWIVFQPKHHERINKLDLTEVVLGEVPPNSSKAWSQNIAIPRMAVSNLSLCSIIKVEYYMEIITEAAGGHKGIEMRFPIILGTVPLTPTNGLGSLTKIDLPHDSSATPDD